MGGGGSTLWKREGLRELTLKAETQYWEHTLPVNRTLLVKTDTYTCSHTHACSCTHTHTHTLIHVRAHKHYTDTVEAKDSITQLICSEKRNVLCLFLKEERVVECLMSWGRLFQM